MKFSSYNMFLGDLYKYGLDYACERAGRLGFGGVELLDLCPARKAGKQTYDMYSVEEYKNAFEKYGLVLACYSSAALLYVDDEEAVLNEIYKQADFAAALGSKLFHHTFTIGLPAKDKVPFDKMLERVLPMAQKIAEHCEKIGMTCLYEPQGAYFNGVVGLSRLYEEMAKNTSNIGVCGDVGNPLFVDVAPEEVFAHFAKQIKHVHIKDYISSDVPLEGRNNNQVSRGGKYLFDCEVGDGVVNMSACLKPLKDLGYDGWFSIEFHGDDETALRMMEYVKKINF